MAQFIGSSPDKDQYYALYLGTTYVTDVHEKNALKMAARLVLEQDHELLNTAREVSMHVLPSHVKVIERSKSAKFPVLLQVPYNRISACFILREDPKVVSIGIADPNQIYYAHVFILTTTELADQMVTAIVEKFKHVYDVSKSKPTVPEPPKSVKSVNAPPSNQMPIADCLLNCF